MCRLIRICILAGRRQRQSVDSIFPGLSVHTTSILGHPPRFQHHCNTTALPTIPLTNPPLMRTVLGYTTGPYNHQQQPSHAAPCNCRRRTIQTDRQCDHHPYSTHDHECTLQQPIPLYCTRTKTQKFKANGQ